MAESTGSAREEAERLVATVLAMAARSGVTRPGGLGETVAGLVGQFTGGPQHDDAAQPDAGRSAAAQPDAARSDAAQSDAARSHAGWATGSAECCVCPVCRVIAGLRDPSPHAAERLATGAGDFATGLASLMRGVSAMTGERRSQRPRPAPAPPDPDAMWTAATRRGTPPEPAPEPDEHDSPWAAATRAAPPEPATDAADRPAQPVTDSDPATTAPSRRVGGDVWAAATADMTVGGVAQPAAVDHDDAGLPASAGGPRTGSAPAAAAAEDPDAGGGDDARTGGRV